MEDKSVKQGKFTILRFKDLNLKMCTDMQRWPANPTRSCTTTSSHHERTCGLHDRLGNECDSLEQRESYTSIHQVKKWAETGRNAALNMIFIGIFDLQGQYDCKSLSVTALLSHH